MAERPASIARSPPLRFVLKNVNCNVWKFYFQAHFQTRAARGQAPPSAWERGLWSAGHALVHPRHMAAIREGRFWAARCATAFQLRGRKKHKSSDGRTADRGVPRTAYPPVLYCTRIQSMCGRRFWRPPAPLRDIFSKNVRRDKTGSNEGPILKSQIAWPPTPS